MCLDDLQQNNEKPYMLGIFGCSNVIAKTQFFSFTNNNILRNELSCATVRQIGTPPYLVVMTSCLENDDHNEKWEFTNNRLKHVKTDLCLDHRALRQGDYVQVAPCDPYSVSQSWTISHTYDQ